jgi:hypothetical protein
MRKAIFLIVIMIGFGLVGCEALGPLAGNTNTGNTAADAQAAQRFLPNLTNYGYTATSASNITNAISQIGGSLSLLTGDPVTAGLISQVDRVMTCYQSVGAVAANVYTDGSVTNVIQGQVPRLGVLAVINQDRVVNNFLGCAIGSQAGIAAQSATVQPCGGTGSFVRDNQTFHYLFIATDPNLCSLFVAAMPAA